jgi:hypothetical protein
VKCDVESTWKAKAYIKRNNDGIDIDVVKWIEINEDRV